jgi:hypothetical protein
MFNLRQIILLVVLQLQLDAQKFTMRQILGYKTVSLVEGKDHPICDKLIIHSSALSSALLSMN